MPDFSWQAVSAAGKLENGQMTAPSAAGVMRSLQERGLTPLKIDGAVDVPAGKPYAVAAPGVGRAGKGPVTSADVMALTTELAIMLRAGLALDNSLRVLIEMSHKTSVRSLVQGILDAVKGGAPLSRALTAHRALFSDFYVNMIRSGEASGQMSAVLDRLVEHMERQRALRDSVISAAIYPAILLGVAVLSLIAMLGFVVPQFEKLFTDMGDALPAPTRLVMGMGQIFTQYGLYIAVAVFVGTALVLRWLRSPSGRAWWQGGLLRLPIVGGLALKYELTLFTRSLGTLLGNGVPMLTALHIATDTVANLTLRQSLARVAPIVKEGGRVVQAVTAAGIFEPLAINLIRVGEETGRVGSIMLEVSNILNREVETGIKRLLTMLEPALILVLGVLIAAIIVSILLGILSVNDLAV